MAIVPDAAVFRSLDTDVQQVALAIEMLKHSQECCNVMCASIIRRDH